MRELPEGPYRFGPFVLDVLNLRLTAGAEICTLEPKSFRLLQFLIENRHRAVPKDEILSVVWEGVAVSDNALTRAVAQIRKALEDDAKEPRYIETIPTLGYRFIGSMKAAEEIPAVITPPVTSTARPKIRLWIGLAATIVVVIGVAAWALRPRVPAASRQGPVAMPLTTYRGTEGAPSFSPDGNQVAFQWDGDKQDNFDIYVKIVGAEAPLRLTTDPSPDLRPAWSPDGTTIAFLRAMGVDRFAVILIPALGGAERRLAEIGGGEDPNGIYLAWSADSKWLVVPAEVPGTGRSQLVRISVESGEVSRILSLDEHRMDRAPNVSPDGTELLFTRRTSRSPGDLYKVRVGTGVRAEGEAQQIPLGGLLVGRAVWGGDGREIFVMSLGVVYRVPAEGTETPQRVNWMPGASGGIAVSRDGKRLTYSAGRGDANVWRLDLEAKGARPEALIASTFRDVYPKYSPDGKRIAFYSTRSGSQQIWVSDAAGGQARQLTFVKAGSAATPSWSPDGKTLVVDVTTGVYQVYTMRAEGGTLKPLTQGPSTNFGGGYSRDGRWVYFASDRTGRTEVWKMPAEGGAAVQVTRNGGVKAMESADGKTIYFSKEPGAGSIWKMAAAGGPEEKLVDSLYRFNFALAKQGIYYMTSQGEDGKVELRFVGFGGGDSKKIADVGYPEFGLDVSPDGRYLIYDQMDDAASDLMLVEGLR